VRHVTRASVSKRDMHVNFGTIRTCNGLLGPSLLQHVDAIWFGHLAKVSGVSVRDCVLSLKTHWEEFSRRNEKFKVEIIKKT